MQGAPFIFKLKSPLNAIAGVGFFERTEQLPISSAWEFYHRKNGVASVAALCSLIGKIRGQPVGPDDTIGCVILSQPTFFPRRLWLPQPRDWSPNTVVGKTYDMDEGEGARIWAQVSERLGPALPPLAISAFDEEIRRPREARDLSAAARPGNLSAAGSLRVWKSLRNYRRKSDSCRRSGAHRRVQRTATPRCFQWHRSARRPSQAVRQRLRLRSPRLYVCREPGASRRIQQRRSLLRTRGAAWRAIDPSAR